MTCLTLGRTGRVDPLGEAAAGADIEPALRGTVLDVDEHGRLVLDRADGEGRIAVDVGDVRQLRPAAS